MTTEALFSQHLESLTGRYNDALQVLGKEGTPVDAILLHSGSEAIYWADDQYVPFRAAAHFNQWVPVNRPDQMVLFQSGKKPVYYQVVPRDYWYEQTVVCEDWWSTQFDIVNLGAPEEVLDHLPPVRRIAFLGENTSFAGQIGLPSSLHNLPRLRNYLDYCRAVKTDYEVARIRDANRLANEGHRAARAAFDDVQSEWGIHMAYLDACGITEYDSPYPNIVALDEKGAILHYQNRRSDHAKSSKVLLIDAGCRLAGYCSDITRTYVRDGAHPVFKMLVASMDRMQQDLVRRVKAGTPYPDLHIEAHRRTGELLRESGICSASPEEIEAQKISGLFFPHGLGHLLGIQVHDVGGHFKDTTGELAPPPPEHRYLRLTRPMEPGMVFTIEPGIYFIPTLLDPERDTPKGTTLNWKLINELIPLGGIRIEDDILVTPKGPQNLTR